MRNKKHSRLARWFLLWFVPLFFSPLFGCFAAPAAAQEVRVAAAADLQYAMDDIARKFEARTGIKVAVTYGSSGNFFSQIQNGAPFDLFFSADADYPRKLVSAGFAAPGPIFFYAVGHVVIWMPASSPVNLAQEGWRALTDARIEKIAVANPEHAPYGRAAIAALQHAGIYDRVKAKLVYGENIAQAAQFVQSGNAQAGILAKSLTYAPALHNGKLWNIPPTLYPTILQGAILLKSAANNHNARSFLEFVQGPAARLTFDYCGLDAPTAADLAVTHGAAAQ